MKALVRLLWTLLLLFGLGACGLFTPYRLVCDEYGFSVEFPEKPIEQSSKNYQGLPKRLWTVQSDSSKEFFSAEATSY